MLRLLTAFLLVSISTGALAKDISLPLNDEEQKALLQILDVATKAGGLQTAQTTLWFAKKIDDANKAPTPPAKPAE